MDAKKLSGLLRSAGYEPQSYSGRGMSGKHCVSVTTDSAFEVLAELIDVAAGDADAENYAEEMREMARVVRGTRTDSMGRQIVAYWPSVRCEPDHEPEEE